jgi:hypothetical protein
MFFSIQYRPDTTEFSWELEFAICQKRSFWTCPCVHAVFIGLNFARVNATLCATVPRVSLEVIVRACCVEPYDGVGRAMPLRRLFVLKGLHPLTERSLTERCADNQQNCYPREQLVSEASRHYFPPANTLREYLKPGSARVSFSQRSSPVTEAQKNPAALDGVRYCLFDSIDGIGRGNRLANATGPDHLYQLA